MDLYAKAVDERDVAAFIRLYALDVRIFDAWDTWEYRGALEWQRPISAWLTAHVSEKLTVAFEEVTVQGSPPFVLVTALVTYGRVSSDETPLGTIQNRLTWILHVHEGRARIVHEHTSVPVDFREMKPFLTQHL